MAKIKKIKKKRKLRKSACVVIIFMFSVASFLMSSIFLKAYNYSLNTKITNIKTMYDAASLENDALKQEIKQMTNKEAVVSVAEKDGMANRQDNVTYITQGE